MTDTITITGSQDSIVVETESSSVVERAADGSIVVTELGVETVAVPADEQETVLMSEPTISTLEVAAPGPQGPAGRDGTNGVGGGGLSFYEFDQVPPATTWTIHHNLGGFFAVTVVDSAGTVVEGAIQYQDADTVILSFSAPFSGTAYLS